jgi:hypothetical protein
LEIQSFNEPYDPAHRLIGTNFSSEVTETPANVGPTTRSRGKQLYSQSRGKAFCPPIPAAARGGIQSLRLPSGDSDSDSSSEEEFDEGDRTDNQSHAEEGKTPEGEDDEDEETSSKRSSEASQDKAKESRQESSREDCNDEDGDAFNHSSEGEPFESTGKFDDVIPDSIDDVVTDPQREDFIHDQNENFDRGNRGGEGDPLESSNNVDDAITYSQRNDFAKHTWTNPLDIKTKDTPTVKQDRMRIANLDQTDTHVEPIIHP